MNILVAFFSRLLLVLIFFPFSALDKILNFKAATGQARQASASDGMATVLILVGLAVEVIMSLCVLTGIADRLAAFILAGYCGVTALLWKPFWRQPDFRLVGPSRGREMFWDFLKNLAVAGGFLMIAFGTNGSIDRLVEHPLSSSQPYNSQGAPR